MQMRLAMCNEVIEIEALYQQSREHAFNVGHVDWPERFPDGFFDSLIQAGELYCFDVQDGIAAAVRLTNEDNPEVWAEQCQPYLYVGKLASANCVRGQNYVKTIALPAIEQEARDRSARGIRLNCLADNPGLIRFYRGAGFTVMGESTFTSKLSGHDITTANFQKLI